MFIAIEGPDGAGKSSLIEAIENEIKAQQPNVEIVRHHKGKPPEETRRCLLKEYAIDLQYDNLFDSVHLADRWHWGERTYAPLKRPHTNIDGYGLLGIAGWRWVELFMQSRGMAQFFLYQTLETIIERVSSRGDDFVQVAELKTIHDAYVDTASHFAILTETLMPGKNSKDVLPEFARHVIELARSASQKASFLSSYPEYIGTIRPKVLLVGDKRNITEQYGEETILPFMPVSDSSGSYLMAALPPEFWKRVGIVNGNDISPKRLSDLHVALGSPPIAALGRLAEKAILRTTIHYDDYNTVPHPQYVRRFRHSEMFDYGLAIQQISEGKGAGAWELK